MGFYPVITAPHKRVLLKYYVPLSLTEGAVATGYDYVFRMNDVFDPDFSAVGYQPVGYDNMALLYGRFKVFNFKARVVFVNDTGATIRCGYALSAQSTAPTDRNAWGTNPRSKWDLLSDQSAGGSKKTYNISCKLSDVLGVRPEEYRTNLEYGSITTTSPSILAYLHVFIVGISTLATAQVAVELSYGVEFSSPVQLNMS